MESKGDPPVFWVVVALASGGNPTVEVDLCTEQALFRAAVPSGASTGEIFIDGAPVYQCLDVPGS